MQDNKLLDNAVEVLSTFIWNVHLKRALHKVDPKPRLNFWRLMYGDLLDMAIIAWCNLFGSHNEDQQPVHWKNIISIDGHDAFRQGLLRHLNVTNDEWIKYRGEILDYRNNQAAHWNPCWAHPNKLYPVLDMALEAGYFYYNTLIDRLAASGIQHHYPFDIKVYCDRFSAQAKEAATKAIAATAGMRESVR